MNLFYDEPDPDRFFKFDRYPRRFVRRLLRGAPNPGGQKMVFLNLLKGLDRIGHAYRVNDFGRARRHPEETVGIVGKPWLLDKMRWKNRILFGAAVFSHPVDDPGLFERLPVRRMLVPGEWMRRMCEPFYGSKVVAWPVGIDTDFWKPSAAAKPFDVLVYQKVHWEYARRQAELLDPLARFLDERNLRWHRIRCGEYRPSDYRRALDSSRAMIWLSEHETQGIAYQEALACDVPVFAWNPGGDWTDPCYYPKIRFGPVSSIPYWDARCGDTFADMKEFAERWDDFAGRASAGVFRPRAYILEHLTLERCAGRYAEHYREVSDEA